MHQIWGQDGRGTKQFPNALMVYEPGSAAEKKLVRKIDTHIVCLAFPPLRSIVTLKRHAFFRFRPYGFCTRFPISTEQTLVRCIASQATRLALTRIFDSKEMQELQEWRETCTYRLINTASYCWYSL